ncbi:MAG: EAL domain-containing protein [Cyanobacteriota bacterium]|nr:EAL domain-containing protein [Cyanobacteriota bacterium]
MVLTQNSVLNRSEVGGLNVLQTPIWILDIEQKQVCWANRAALSLWDIETVEEFIRQQGSDGWHRLPATLQETLDRLELGQTAREVWPIPRIGGSISMSCTCSGVQLENGRGAVLVEGILNDSPTDDIDRVPNHWSYSELATPHAAGRGNSARTRFLSLEGVIEAIDRLLSHGDRAEGIYQALAALGEATQVDRVYLWENHFHPVSGEVLLSQRTQWQGDGVTAGIESQLQSLSYREFLPNWYDRFLRGQPIFGSVGDFQPCERDLFNPWGIRSMLVIPIEISGHFWGCIGFDECHRDRGRSLTDGESSVRDLPWSDRANSILSSAIRRLGETIAHLLSQAELESRDRLLEGVAWSTNLLLTKTDRDRSLYQALKMLGYAAQVDRVCVLEHRPHPLTGERTTVPRWEWSNDGESDSKERSNSTKLSKWYRTFSIEEPICVLVRDLETRGREFWELQGVRSILALPIEVEGKFWGFLEFDDCRTDRLWSETEKLILRAAAGSFGGAISRQETETKLKERDRLLDGVATATTGLLTTHDDRVGIEQALAALGYAASVDRVYILERHLDPVMGCALVSQRYEWQARLDQSDLESRIEGLQNLPCNGVFVRWFECLHSGQLICGLVRDLPQAERGFLQTPNVRSFALVPIESEGECWGFLGFDECQGDRQWSESEKSILKAAAGSIGGAIARQKTAAQLANLNAQLERRVQERTAELMMVNRQLNYNTYHDTLTGLPNRVLLMEALEKALARDREQPEYSFAILLLDLDRFKVINDSFGHSLGDRMLVESASRLMTCVRHGDLVARLGGDEFAILLNRTHHLKDATRIAERVKTSLTRPFHLEGHEILTTVSIGIALSSPNYKKPEDLLRDADTVMCQAKQRGQSYFEVFDTTMHEQVLAQLRLERLEHDLRRAVTALEPHQFDAEPSDDIPFQVYYQPIVSLNTNRITAFEALMRWQHPELGQISPAQFIPIAEKTGSIVTLGTWILNRACHQLRAWQQQLRHRVPLKMSVNLSGRQFAQVDLIDQIDRILRATQLDGSNLKLEVTESAIVDNYDSATAILLQLKDRNIHLCMDDFGTGYSSLSYLHRFPLDTLKIDRSFVSPIQAGGEKAEILQTIITLAHNLGMNAIAEGVETPIQCETLHRLGCEFGQGYFFSKPVNAQLATQLLF